ncbi:hypothetical protein SCB49_08778 [unidentified eubacterium SCB49]|nr:hypothetical protein SCB49_08778 [unidentified eubacterium SCB49]
MSTSIKKTILVAPLNWGLGHATRCIPIIKALLAHNYNVILASDGAALKLLKQEFPALPSVILPSYNITYPKNGSLFTWHMVLKFPKLYTAVKREKKIIDQLVEKGTINGIISDNRLGVRNKNIPCVYITHQLRVPTGNTTLLSSKLHQKYIVKFDACWVPDYKKEPNLSGRLGHVNKLNKLVKHIGPLSRMTPKATRKSYDILAVLSGPEPQRTLLEEKLISQLAHSNKKVALIQGVVEDKQKWSSKGNLKILNYATTLEIEKLINESDLIISRSGYTTIMDLAALNKKAFLIPTPGQFEQEYLAKRLHDKQIVPSCSQDNFTLEQLALTNNFLSWPISEVNPQDFKELFSIF